MSDEEIAMELAVENVKLKSVICKLVEAIKFAREPLLELLIEGDTDMDSVAESIDMIKWAIEKCNTDCR